MQPSRCVGCREPGLVPVLPDVVDVTPEGLKLVELAPGVSFEQIQSKTGVTLLR